MSEHLLPGYTGRMGEAKSTPRSFLPLASTRIFAPNGTVHVIGTPTGTIVGVSLPIEWEKMR